jgi:hypothetical protein
VRRRLRRLLNPLSTGVSAPRREAVDTRRGSGEGRLVAWQADATARAVGTRRSAATYAMCVLGLGLLGVGVWTATRSLSASVNGVSQVCGSILDPRTGVRLLSLDAFFSQREGCALVLAKAHVAALAAGAAGLLTSATATVRWANARSSPR